MRFLIAILAVANSVGCAQEEPAASSGTDPQRQSSRKNSDVQPPQTDRANDAMWEPKEETQFETDHLEVLAGDLIQVTTPSGETAQMSLYAVAAPKLGQPMHEQSKAGLMHRLKNRTVTVRIRRIKDKKIMVDLKVPPEKASTGGPHGHNLPPTLVNGDMVRWGLAWHDSKEVPDNRPMADRQESAMKNRRGLWGEEGSPTPPWEWKKDGE